MGNTALCFTFLYYISKRKNNFRCYPIFTPLRKIISNYNIMRKILIISLIIIIHSTLSIAQTGWFNVQSGTSKTIRSQFFINNQTGWICGDTGLIKKTNNGGYSWTQQITPTSYTLYTLFFINENTGWSGGGYFDINTYGMNTIIKTTNGGTNWFIQLNELEYGNYFTQSIYFVDSNTGFAGYFGSMGFGVSGTIAKTTNGGLNWVQISGANPSTKILFQNSNTGWSISHFWSDYGGSDSGMIYKTTNSGINWILCLAKQYWTFNYISFFNANTGIVQGYRSSPIYWVEYIKTTNAGISWDTIYSGTDYHFSGYFLNEFTGWACGYKIDKTTNGGYNWFSQTQNLSNLLYGITFKDSLNGWAVGGGGKILKTTTGGTTFIHKEETEIPDKFSLFQNYPNPFNPATKIKFDLPSEGKSQKTKVKLVIYDILGKEIQTLVNEQLQPGSYEVTFDGSNLTSGIYFYRMKSGNYAETKRMVLVK